MFYELLACTSVLRTWKENPALKRRDYRFMHAWGRDQGPEADEPLSFKEVAWRKEFLRAHAPSQYPNLFPDERVLVFSRTERREVILGLMQERPFRRFWVLTNDCRAVKINERAVLEQVDCLRVCQL